MPPKTESSSAIASCISDLKVSKCQSPPSTKPNIINPSNKDNATYVDYEAHNVSKSYTLDNDPATVVSNNHAYHKAGGMVRPSPAAPKLLHQKPSFGFFVDVEEFNKNVIDANITTTQHNYLAEKNNHELCSNQQSAHAYSNVAGVELYANTSGTPQSRNKNPFQQQDSKGEVAQGDDACGLDFNFQQEQQSKIQWGADNPCTFNNTHTTNVGDMNTSGEFRNDVTMFHKGSRQGLQHHCANPESNPLGGRRKRRHIEPHKLKVLEHYFEMYPKPDSTIKLCLANQLEIPLKSLQIWFQNRRAKARANGVVFDKPPLQWKDPWISNPNMSNPNAGETSGYSETYLPQYSNSQQMQYNNSDNLIPNNNSSSSLTNNNTYLVPNQQHYMDQHYYKPTSTNTPQYFNSQFDNYGNNQNN